MKASLYLPILAVALLAPVISAGAVPDPSVHPHYFGPYSNYANSPLTVPDAFVDITGGNGTGALAEATVNPKTGGLAAITVTAPGAGYTSPPHVAITGLGTAATATAVVNTSGNLSSIVVDAVGWDYTAPVATVSGGGGSGATATAWGGVDWVTITNGGTTKYNDPIVTFSLPELSGGVRATGAAWVDTAGAVIWVEILNVGSGYTHAPTVTILDGSGSLAVDRGARATATLAVDGVTIGNYGTGYTFPPTVTITDSLGGIGGGATATATIAVGSVTAINVTNAGTGYMKLGIKKFIDTLPGLGATSANNLGQYLSVAVPDTTTYPGSDYYEIGVVQYRMKMHTSLPASLLRGYVQISTIAVPGARVPLSNAKLDPALPVTPIVGYYGVEAPHYLGPSIVATKDRPVRILFRNLLPNGVAGNLFLPVDPTVMGSGAGPLAPQDPPVDLGTVFDEVRNPMGSAGFMPGPDNLFTQNRATLHLHGGLTPWISDGTPHQWITPAGESTSYPKGVSVSNVPDMPDPGPGAMTFFYTNQQSARLMFYHDHAWGLTRLNVYAGEAAGYLVKDPTETALTATGGALEGLGIGLPLIIQDKTFVPDPAQLAATDPTWNSARWGGQGNLWVPHVMMPAQNPGDSTGSNPFGRWMYGPYFWPPADPKYGPIANPYFDENVDPNNLAPGQYYEPPLIPGVPNVSVGMEAFNDTPIVNGTAYPTTTLQPKTYRFRILNAANDRFWNLQWYVADASKTEVALNAAEVDAAQTNPDIFPTPDLALSPAGPDWIMIGSEGGFLPSPVVISGHQPTTWIINPTRFDVGNVDLHSLLLAPAERADVIVDFSAFAGKTLILYNDAPAAFPARVATYDYYTGAPDLTGSGGVPTILPGYGPNTRTIMQVKIAATARSKPFNLAKLNAAFAHHLVGGIPAGVFESSQDPIIVGQGAYNTAYGTSFASFIPPASPSSPPIRDGFARIQDMSLTFNTLLRPTGSGESNTLTIPFKNKGLHDEMNSAVFDDYGRMSANLGLEAPGATPLTQNIILYPYINPPSEILKGVELPGLTVTPISSATDGTQIWKLTHNGVDTHPIHFHLFNVQLLNRVTWDGIIIPPEASEIGWKETVRVSPLEDTIVAFRPIIPKLPFGLPESKRPLNPAMPIGDPSGFNNTDWIGNPLTGVNAITNQITNFGWEYVWHCHILGHEEMDMMRPVQANVTKLAPRSPSWPTDGLTVVGSTIVLKWVDPAPVTSSPSTWGDPTAEIGFQIERGVYTTYPGTPPGTYAIIGTVLANQTTFTDKKTTVGKTYSYRVRAYNAAGSTLSDAKPKGR
ncbi:MAG: multicopper oxidase domain-containing protein [Verrucomicrobia bacterium]|nr:multicopper oxidase domain-containing protein [Verrucomicrobiota bacterium]